MSVADDIQRLANASQTGAHQVLEALIALGPRPTTSPADLAWDQTSTRLTGQMDSLTALVSKLSANAVIVGLSDYADAATQLGQVSASAEEEIKHIFEVSKLLTTLSRVLDVGLAVLALASAPSPAGAAALVGRISALADDLDD